MMSAISGRREGAGKVTRFEELIEPLLGNAFGLAYSMLGNRSAAEDAVQEAATKAWRSIDRLRDGSAPRPWFLAIVANQCRDARRSARRSVALNVVPDAIVPDHADRVARDVDLARALGRLSPEQRG